MLVTSRIIKHTLFHLGYNYVIRYYRNYTIRNQDMFICPKNKTQNDTKSKLTSLMEDVVSLGLLLWTFQSKILLALIIITVNFGYNESLETRQLICYIRVYCTRFALQCMHKKMAEIRSQVHFRSPLKGLCVALESPLGPVYPPPPHTHTHIHWSPH